MKYIKAAVVLTAMALTAANVTAFARAPYTDIGNVAAETAINYLYDTKCLTFAGTVDIRLFHPDQAITRGELAKLLCDTMPVFQTAGDINKIENPVQAGAKAVSAMLRCGYHDQSGRWHIPSKRYCYTGGIGSSRISLYGVLSNGDCR